MLLKLILSFTKIGMIGFGGGSAVAPLIHKEAVIKHGWIDDEEFIDIVAIANSLPGPSMPQMAAAIGYKISGVIGAIISAICIIFPMALLFVVIMVALLTLIPIEFLGLFVTPVLGVIVAMMVSLTKRFLLSSLKDLGIILIIVIAGSVAALVYFFDVNPAYMILVMLISVFLFSKGGAKE